jgi:hypothetical protein
MPVFYGTKYKPKGIYYKINNFPEIPINPMTLVSPVFLELSKFSTSLLS